MVSFIRESFGNRVCAVVVLTVVCIATLACAGSPVERDRSLENGWDSVKLTATNVYIREVITTVLDETTPSARWSVLGPIGKVEIHGEHVLLIQVGVTPRPPSKGDDPSGSTDDRPEFGSKYSDFTHLMFVTLTPGVTSTRNDEGSSSETRPTLSIRGGAIAVGEESLPVDIDSREKVTSAIVAANMRLRANITESLARVFDFPAWMGRYPNASGLPETGWRYLDQQTNGSLVFASEHDGGAVVWLDANGAIHELNDVKTSVSRLVTENSPGSDPPEIPPQYLSGHGGALPLEIVSATRTADGQTLILTDLAVTDSTLWDCISQRDWKLEPFHSDVNENSSSLRASLSDFSYGAPTILMSSVGQRSPSGSFAPYSGLMLASYADWEFLNRKHVETLVASPKAVVRHLTDNRFVVIHKCQYMAELVIGQETEGRPFLYRGFGSWPGRSLQEAMMRLNYGTQRVAHPFELNETPGGLLNFGSCIVQNEKMLCIAGQFSSLQWVRNEDSMPMGSGFSRIWSDGDIWFREDTISGVAMYVDALFEVPGSTHHEVVGIGTSTDGFDRSGFTRCPVAFVARADQAGARSLGSLEGDKWNLGRVENRGGPYLAQVSIVYETPNGPYFVAFGDQGVGTIVTLSNRHSR